MPRWFHGSVASCARMLSLLCPLVLSATAAQAGYLVDTGPGHDGVSLPPDQARYWSAYSNDGGDGAWIYAQITVHKTTTLSQIDWWMKWDDDFIQGRPPRSTGSVGLMLTKNDRTGCTFYVCEPLYNMPGTMLYNTTFQRGASDAYRWEGFEVDWTIAAGTYWIGLYDADEEDDFAGRLALNAPRPAERYAYRETDSGGSGYRVLDETYAAGFRVTAVPEPETYVLMLLGLGVVGGVAARRRRRC